MEHYFCVVPNELQLPLSEFRFTLVPGACAVLSNVFFPSSHHVTEFQSKFNLQVSLDKFSYSSIATNVPINIPYCAFVDGQCY